MQPDSEDIFSNAKSYERYVGRWSRFVAERFVAWLDVGVEKVWLDVGAGTGILTQVVLQKASPSRVLAMDLSPDYLDFARDRIHHKRVEFKLGDAARIAVDVPEFDAAVAGLVLNFVPSAEQVTQSMMHGVKNGGVVASYVWDYSGQMEMMRHFWDAANVVDPKAGEMDAGQRYLICQPENLQALYERLGLQQVEVAAIDILTVFNDFEDYWQPFLGAQGDVSSYLRSQDARTIAAIRDQVRQQLPFAEDGSITLPARAWAVKGTKAV